MTGWTGELCTRLDALLGRAVAIARALDGSSPETEPFRGMLVTATDAERLAEGDVLPLAAPELLVGAPDPGGIGELLELDDFERGVLAVALAPELALRYERVLGFLQDDLTRRRPSVELVLALLCADPGGREASRSRLGPRGRLMREAITIAVDEHGVQSPSSLGLAVAPAPGIVDRLFGEQGIDRALSAVASLDPQPSGPLPAAVERAIAGPPDLVHLHAPNRDLVRAAAAGLASEAGRALLTVDADAAGDGMAALAPLVLRDARLEAAMLLIENVDAQASDPAALGRLVASRAVPVILGGLTPSPPALASQDEAALVSVRVPAPPVMARIRLWDAALTAAGIELPTSDRESLARRFRLSPQLIDRAAAHAGALARGRGAPAGKADVLASAHAMTGTELAQLTTAIVPRATWDDLVAPEDTKAQLRELCARVDHRERVLDDWGLAPTRGRGVTALFAGPSGTGKTMAAEVVANELGLPLARIELARVVSKYIGETEKNLDEIFAAAQRTDAILLFDEADALFGKRSEVRDAHDRYANLEISYLLQRMEDHDGVAILSTNLRRNIDDAFVRRLAFTIQFPFPEAADRRRIWDRAWPEAVRVGDVDLDRLAADHALSGGGIRNAAVAAAFAAAADGGVVRPEHVLRAVERERGKLGATAQVPAT